MQHHAEQSLRKFGLYRQLRILIHFGFVLEHCVAHLPAILGRFLGMAPAPASVQPQQHHTHFFLPRFAGQSGSNGQSIDRAERLPGCLGSGEVSPRLIGPEPSKDLQGVGLLLFFFFFRGGVVDFWMSCRWLGVLASRFTGFVVTNV